MEKQIIFTLTEEFYLQIKQHLFPGDGLEAIALGLCGHAESSDRIKVVLHKIYLIPYEACDRKSDQVTWSTDLLREVLIEAGQRSLSIVKIHSHPSGYSSFSRLDDISDSDLLNSKTCWTSLELKCISLIMLPGGSLLGRIVNGYKRFTRIGTFQVMGQQIAISSSCDSQIANDSDRKNAQTLGEGTVNVLKKVKVAVVGCSGTGSPVIEQLARLGVGNFVLVDPDRIEFKNLNRILNSRPIHAEEGMYKVELFANLIHELDPSVSVKAFAENVFDSQYVLRELSTCDIIFGCVDSVDGRHLLNLLSTYYCIPYFDIGVKLIADGLGGIEKICGTVHYLRPGGSSLLTRGVYTSEDLRAASLLRMNPTEYDKLAEEKYIKRVHVERPAVISVNMQIASTAVNEFLCRIHKIRTEDLDNFAIARICISDAYLQYEAESNMDSFLKKYVGVGDRVPFLNLPELTFSSNGPIQELQEA